jgi:3-hydroxybutyryl-CoA dehydrogenase
MGPGIALVLSRAGCRVRLCARREASLEAARGRLGDGVLMTTSAEEALAGSGLVIETIAEELEPKQQILALAERLAAPDAILTTNTSSLPLGPLAGALQQPERFAGLHWFNPPDLVELVEVVPAAATDAATVETLRAWTTALGKAPVVLRRDASGFIGNRLQYALMREAWALVESGVCGYEDVDRALTHGLGPRWAAVGPFQTVDLAGLDIHLASVRNLFAELAAGTEPPDPLVSSVARGALGAKSGEGLLGRYDEATLARLAARRERMARAAASIREEAT